MYAARGDHDGSAVCLPFCVLGYCRSLVSYETFLFFFLLDSTVRVFFSFPFSIFD